MRRLLAVLAVFVVGVLAVISTAADAHTDDECATIRQHVAGEELKFSAALEVGGLTSAQVNDINRGRVINSKALAHCTPTATTTTTVAPTTTAPVTTTTTAPPTLPPGEGFVVGSGVSSMTFPEKPGLLGGESLPTWPGPWSFTEGTHVIDGYRIDRRIEMRSGNPTVTIRNSIIAVDDYYGILGDHGTLTLEHNLVDGSVLTGQQMTAAAVGGTVLTVKFNEFRNNCDNIRIGWKALVEWNWMHDSRPGSSDTCHADGIEVYDAPRPAGWVGPHTFVRHNHIDIQGGAGATGAVNLTAYFGPVDGVRIEGNTFMPGGTYSLYVRNDSTGCVNVEVVNNRWFGTDGYTDGGFYGSHSVEPQSCVSEWSGNTLQNLDGSNLRDNPL